MTSAGRTGTAEWIIVVSRLWGWCKVMPPGRETYWSEAEARDALVQLGPSDGRVVRAR